MDLDDPAAAGKALAERHAVSAKPEPAGTLGNYAERSRIGDWTMRSALMRHAQPHAERTAMVLTLVRRLDAVLQTIAKPLERTTVSCDRALSIDSIDAAPVDGYPDTRTADLARLQRADPERFEQMLAAYEAGTDRPLDLTEHAALPLFGVALELDELAETLAGWAAAGPADPPVDAVDHIGALVQARLDELGVPVEQGSSRGHRGRRDRGV